MSRSFNDRKLKILAAIIQNPGSREFEVVALLGLNPGHSAVKNALFDLRKWGYVWLLCKKTIRYWYPTIEGTKILKSHQKEKVEAIPQLLSRSCPHFPS
jgi:hypothetical protein